MIASACHGSIRHAATANTASRCAKPCAEAQFGGYTRNDGFADYILADPNYVAYIPDGLSEIDAAPIICAGITTYKGIKETDAGPGGWFVISGAGGLGQLAIQYAEAMRPNVCAGDIDAGKL